MKRLIVIVAVIFANFTSANDDLPEFSIKEIQEGVYLHKSFNRVDGFGLVSSNGLVVVDNNNAFIVDTPWSETDTETLVSWVKDKGYDLLGSVSTHSHTDRTAGIQWLNTRSISTYATTQTNDILKKQQQALATISLETTDTQLADGLLEVFYPGAGHTIDNIVIWLPKAQILFGGCFIKSLGSKNLGYTGEAYIKEWPNSVEKVLLQYPDAKLVVPGHGETGGMVLLTHTQTLAESAFHTLTQVTNKIPE